MTHQTAERRVRPRLKVHGAVQYQQEGAEDIEDGELDNISLGGFRLWSGRALAVNTRLWLLIDSAEADTAPVRIPATVVRTDLEKKGTRYGYGCRIDGIIHPRSWFDLVYRFRGDRR